MTQLPKMSEMREGGDGGGDGAKGDVKENVEADELIAQPMEVIHHDANAHRRLTIAEFFDDLLGSRRAAAFDQNEIAGRGDFGQQLGGFTCRSYGDAFLQAGFLRGLRDDLRPFRRWR